MAALIPDEKRLLFLDKEYFWVAQNAAGYHPGQVLPSRADGAPLGTAVPLTIFLNFNVILFTTVGTEFKNANCSPYTKMHLPL